MRKAAIFLFALIFSMASALHAFGQQEGAHDLLPILLNGKWGFIDRTGKIVIQPKFEAFDDNDEWSEGLMAVRAGGLWGYVGEGGAIKIAPQFKEARGFGEGLAPVKAGYKWGFIDQSGRMVIAPQFEEVAVGYAMRRTFSEGLAPVKANGKWGFIDKAGKFVIKPQFDEAAVFLSGIARVSFNGKSDNPRTVGFINKSGKFVSQPVNPDSFVGFGFYPGQFSEGLALTWNDGKWGYVNTEGEIVSTGFDKAKYFSEGLAAVKMGERWGFIDKSGKIVIEPRFLEVERFSEGLAIVTEDDGTLGYIDQTGKLVITVGKRKDFIGNSYYSSFNGGLATINLTNESGYIDRTGKFVIRLEKGDWADPFYREWARVGRGENSTFVDRTGKYLFEPKLLFDPGKWSEGLMAARIERNGRYGYIDQTGRFVIPPQFDEADEFSDGLAHVRVVNKHGFIDRSGKFVFPLEFDEASPLYEGIARVGLGEERYGWIGRQGVRQKIGYIDKTGKYIWKPTN